jgi:hypothetical protein
MSEFSSSDGSGGEGTRRGRPRQRTELPFYRHARTLAVGNGFVLYSYSRLDSVTVEWDGDEDEPTYTFRDRTGADWEQYDTLYIPESFYTSNILRRNVAALWIVLYNTVRRASVRRIELETCSGYGGLVPGLLQEFRGIVEIQADRPSPNQSELMICILRRDNHSRFTSILLDCGNSEDDWIRFAAAVNANRNTLRAVFVPEPWFDDAKRDEALAKQLSSCPVLETVVCKLPPTRFARIIAACKLESLREVVLDAGTFDGNGDAAVGWMPVLHSRCPRLEALTFIAPGVAWGQLPAISRSAAYFTHLRKFSVIIGKTERGACPVEHASVAFDALRDLARLDTLGIGDVPRLYEFILNKLHITTLCLENSASRSLDPKIRLLVVQRHGRIWVLDAEQESPDPDVEDAVMDRRPTLSIIDEFVGEPMLSEMIGGFKAEFHPTRNSAPDRYGPREPDSPAHDDDM